MQFECKKKRLSDCPFSLCFVCLLAGTENTLTVLQFSGEKKPSVFTERLPEAPGLRFKHSEGKEVAH